MRRNRKAYITIDKEDIEYVSEILNGVLACLRAQSLSYQTSHWQVAGSHFYQEHLLLERLYNSVLEEIDVLAEKISGLVGSDQVSLENQIPKMAMFLGQWAKIPDHLRRGLTSEETLQELLRNAFDELQEAGLISLGLEDWLAATASAHEANIYLLQQTINPRAKHISASRKRLRRRYAENTEAKDVFFADPRRVEVEEFARSNAVSNDLSTFENTLREDRGHEAPLSVEVSEFEESPVTPTEVLEMPGAKELSTLNRFVVEAENPDLDDAIEMNAERETIAINAMIRRVVKASKDWLEDYVFEYKDLQDLNDQLEGWASGFVSPPSIEDVKVEGDVAYVTYTRTQPIRVKKSYPWWKGLDEGYSKALNEARRDMLDYMEKWARKSNLNWVVSEDPSEVGNPVSLYLDDSDSDVFFDYAINPFENGENHFSWRSPSIDNYEEQKISASNLSKAMSDSIKHFEKVFDKYAPIIEKDYLVSG